MELQVGSVVRSKAGHDVGQYFVVVEMNSRYVFICDGKQRPLERSKRKNRLHIAVTKTKLSSEDMETNHGLRKSLRQYLDNEA